MGSINQPFVSVVTPCYNEEKYLSQCIESVLSQTYENFEYIIVNNCSTDRTLEIANSYAKKDARIRIHNNEIFLDQRPNFNHALRQISHRSEYCKIVMGDDWIFPDCLARMVKVAEENPSVGIVGAYRIDDVTVNCDGLPYPSTVISGRDISRRQLLNGIFVFGSASSLLFRSEIIENRNPFYNESSLHEDTEACYEILQEYDFGFVHQVLTYTRRENISVTSRIKNFNPYLLDKFVVMMKYGRIYLDEKEYQQLSKRITGKYYHFLAESIFARKGRGFWEYHKNGLQTIGYSLDFVKLSKYALLILIDLICNPKNMVERIIRKTGV